MACGGHEPPISSSLAAGGKAILMQLASLVVLFRYSSAVVAEVAYL
jgi:hypothetical protein